MALKVMADPSEYGAERDAALYYFKTNGDYIFEGIGNEFAASYSTKSRLGTINNGMGVCGGRHITEKRIGTSNSQITLPANSSGYLTIRMQLGADPDCYLWTGSALVHGNLNNGDTIRDLPLYAFVTSATGITSFIDIRPISKGNEFVLRMEDGQLYTYSMQNGKQVKKKVVTKEV